MAQMKEYFNLELKWKNNNSAEFPYYTTHKVNRLVLRINDFPEEELYTLLIDNEEIGHFTNWPTKWKRIKE